MTRHPDVVGRAHRRLRAADSIEAVLAVVAVFLQELPQARIEALPADCRPRRIATQEDVLHWAQRLESQRMLGAQGTRSPGFRALHDFFLHAAVQANRLRPRRVFDPPVAIPRRIGAPGPRSGSKPATP